MSAQTASSGSGISSAPAHLNGDIESPVNDATAAQTNVKAALAFFSSMEVPEGTTAMAQASLEFRAAAAVNGQVR